MTRVVAVRHGETDWNRNGRMQGWAPVELNAAGREQAAAVAGWLAGAYDVDRVVASDLLRARETADRVAAAVDVAVETDAAWRERDLGVYQGLPYADVEARFPEFGLDATAYEAADRTPESGESLREMADRVVAALEALGGREETVAVVAHGGPLCVLLGHVKGLSLPAALDEHHLDNCGVSEFELDGGRRRVVAENVTAWR